MAWPEPCLVDVLPRDRGGLLNRRFLAFSGQGKGFVPPACGKRRQAGPEPGPREPVLWHL